KGSHGILLLRRHDGADRANGRKATAAREGSPANSRTVQGWLTHRVLAFCATGSQLSFHATPAPYPRKCISPLPSDGRRGRSRPITLSEEGLQRTFRERS